MADQTGPYLSISQACELLKISKPTLNRLRKEGQIKTFFEGVRPRFHRAELEKLVGRLAELKPRERPRLNLSYINSTTALVLETQPNVFDLRLIDSFDPHGVLSLFCVLVERGHSVNRIRLLVEDNVICNFLKGLGFFLELEKQLKEKVIWDRSALKSTYQDLAYPISLTEITMKKQEAPVVEQLVSLLRKQGFSEAIGGYIGWIIGELVDNSMTHLMHSGQAPSCYILAQRYRIPKLGSECLIISVADRGPGIPATLKTNPRYASLSDQVAFLMAFKPRVSSWGDEYNRGKGLTDMLGIAMGNGSQMRAESGDLSFLADFKNDTNSLTNLQLKISGTRITLCLIDKEFTSKLRPEIAKYIDAVIGAL